VRKTPPNSYTARQFYAAKDRAGKRPGVVHKHGG
jgi:hypothetical protein